MYTDAKIAKIPTLKEQAASGAKYLRDKGFSVPASVVSGMLLHLGLGKLELEAGPMVALRLLLSEDGRRWLVIPDSLKALRDAQFVPSLLAAYESVVGAMGRTKFERGLVELKRDVCKVDPELTSILGAFPEEYEYGVDDVLWIAEDGFGLAEGFACIEAIASVHSHTGDQSLVIIDVQVPASVKEVVDNELRKRSTP